MGRGSLHLVAREVVTPGAIADLVGCAFDTRTLTRRRELGFAPILEWAPLACVGACERPSTTAELAHTIGLSVSAVRKAVAHAVAHGALLRDGLLLERNPAWKSPVRRLVAAELKLSDWQKAIAQADVYAGWADETWIILARSASDALYDAVEERGIGLAFLEARALIVVQRPRPKRQSPFAVSRLLAGEQALAQAAVVIPRPAIAREPDAMLVAPAS